MINWKMVKLELENSMKKCENEKLKSLYKRLCDGERSYELYLEIKGEL